MKPFGDLYGLELDIGASDGIPARRYTSSGRPSDPANLLGPLLFAGSMTCAPGRTDLRPLWNEEATRRAKIMVELYLLQEHRYEVAAPSGEDRARNWRRATRLMRGLDTLAVVDEPDEQPCSSVLREVLLSMISLFHDIAERFTFAMQVDRIVLTPHRRRALVLACLTIVTDALWWSSTSEGRRSVSLSLGDTEGHGVMTIEDDGFDRFHHEGNGAHRLLMRLSAVLEGEVLYRKRADEGTAIEIVFPCRSPDIETEPRPDIHSDNFPGYSLV
jgi:hypothetical protein